MTRQRIAQFTTPRNLAALFTLTAGSLQALLAFSALFLPVFATCFQTSSGSSCYYESYMEMGGTALGYGFLLSFIGLGVGAVISTVTDSEPHICAFRWLLLMASVLFAVIGGWSIGLAFAPGGLLVLLPALSCLRDAKKAALPAKI